MPDPGSKGFQIMRGYGPSIIVGAAALSLIWWGTFSRAGLFSPVPSESGLSEAQGVIVSCIPAQKAVTFKLDSSPLEFYYGNIPIIPILSPNYLYSPTDIVAGTRCRVWYNPESARKTGAFGIWQLALDDSFLVRYENVIEARHTNSYLMLAGSVLGFILSVSFRLFRIKEPPDGRNSSPT